MRSVTARDSSNDVVAVLRRRLLRTYISIARNEATCWHCQEPIFPGDEYETEVFAVRLRLVSGRIWDRVTTWKRHRDPCDPPDDEDYRDEEDEKDEDVEETSSNDLPIAA